MLLFLFKLGGQGRRFFGVFFRKWRKKRNKTAFSLWCRGLELQVMLGEFWCSW